MARIYDDATLKVFLAKQTQLFDEKVAETMDEADEFLDELLAVVVDSADEVIEYFEEEGVDMDGIVSDGVFTADEVFEIGDGRYLIVEG